GEVGEGVRVGVARRWRGSRKHRSREDTDPADVYRLYPTTWNSHGPPAPAAGRLVWRPRLRAPHQDLHRTGCGRRRCFLRRAGTRRLQHRPKGDNETTGKHRPTDFGRRLARTGADWVIDVFIPRKSQPLLLKSL